MSDRVADVGSFAVVEQCRCRGISLVIAIELQFGLPKSRVSFQGEARDCLSVRRRDKFWGLYPLLHLLPSVISPG